MAKNIMGNAEFLALVDLGARHGRGKREIWAHHAVLTAFVEPRPTRAGAWRRTRRLFGRSSE